MKSKLFLYAIFILISGTISAQEKPEPAGKIIDEACKLAGKEKKNVMIVFHASWCGWCKKFEASLTDPSCKDFFDEHFIIRYLDILERADKKDLENPEAMEVYKKYGGEGGGIPFFLIFDIKKNLLSDSKMKAAGNTPDKPPQNIGCPTSDDEVAAFIQILSKATKISDVEKTALTERFKKNRNN